MISNEWKKLDSEGRVFTGQYEFPGGVSRSLLLKLSGNSFLVYSPGKELLEPALQILTPDSEVILLVPAAGHTLGLVAWHNRCQNSQVVASDAAKPRIQKKTSLAEINDLSVLDNKLPSWVALHVMPSCNWGEVWLSLDLDGKLYWAVCDSFMNMTKLPDKLIIRTLLKLFRYGPGLEISRTFQYMGINDKAVYRDWAIQQFSNDRENALIPCHGDIDDSTDFTERVIDLLKKRFK